MRENQLRDSKSRTWLLTSALISVATLYTICNSNWVPGFVAQTAEGGMVAGAAAIHGASNVDRSAAQHDGSSSGAHRTIASGRNEARTHDFRNQSLNHGVIFPATNAAEAKTSKSIKNFMVPPPPPSPCVLPPAFGFFPVQPAQQQAVPQQESQQAQAQTSPMTHDENMPQQSDAELQSADQELQAALRSSLITVGEWKR